MLTVRVLLVLLAMCTVSHAADLKFDDTHHIGVFGTYSDAYLHRRWVRMCRGPARYDAMREAYDMRKPDPCSGAKEWRR